MALITLSITKSYADGKILEELYLDNICTDTETWAGYTNNNLTQIGLDAYGAGVYTWTNDGVQKYTNTLYNKQSGDDTDTGETTLSVATTWTDVDATDASITFTPEIAGNFKVAASCNVEIIADGVGGAISDLYFRLSDGTNHGVPVRAHWKLATASATDAIVFSVKPEILFSNATVASKTVKLQYYRNTHTNITSAKVIAGSVGTGTYGTYFTMEKI